MPLTKIKSLGITDGTITSADLAAGVGGKVLQVVQTVKIDTFATNPSSTWIDVTGLSVSITPSSSSNKVLIQINISGAGYTGVNVANFRLVRGATTIYAGTTAGSRNSGFSGGIIAIDSSSSCNTSGIFLDSPSTTSSTTYKIQTFSNGTVYVNRTYGDTDNADNARSASTITVTEIAG